MSREYVNKIMLAGVLIFVAWVSFAPDPVHCSYGGMFKIALFGLLALSLSARRFDAAGYFINKNEFFWIYLVLFSFNIWFASDRFAAYEYYSDFVLTAAPIYFLITNEIKKIDIKKALYGLCVCAGAVSVIGFFEMLLKTNFIYERFAENYYYGRFIVQGRMMSTFTHPNILGSYLIMCVPPAYYFYRSEYRRGIRHVNLAIFALICSAVFLTFSRGTWIAGLLMVSVWLLFRRRYGRLVFIWIAFFLLIAFLSSPFISGNVRYRFGMPYLWEYLRDSHRTNAYFVTYNMLKDHPFVGIGLGNYRQLFGVYSNVQFPFEVMIPDSVYLMHLAEAGLIGFAGFLIFLGNLLRKCLAYLKKNDKGMFFAVFMGFTGMLFNMASYDMFMWKAPFNLYWFFAAVLAGTAMSQDKSRAC